MNKIHVVKPTTGARLSVGPRITCRSRDRRSWLACRCKYNCRFSRFSLNWFLLLLLLNLQLLDHTLQSPLLHRILYRPKQLLICGFRINSQSFHSRLRCSSVNFCGLPERGLAPLLSRKCSRDMVILIVPTGILGVFCRYTWRSSRLNGIRLCGSVIEGWVLFLGAYFIESDGAGRETRNMYA